MVRNNKHNDVYKKFINNTFVLLAGSLLVIFSLCELVLRIFRLSHWMPIITLLVGIVFIWIPLIKVIRLHIKDSPKIRNFIEWGINIVILVFVSFLFGYFSAHGFKSSISCEIIDATRQLEDVNVDTFKILLQYFPPGVEKEYKFPESCIKTILQFKNEDSQPRSIESINLIANMNLGKAQNILASRWYIELLNGSVLFNPIITVGPKEILRKEIHFFYPFLPNKYNCDLKDNLYPQLNCFKIVYQDSVSATGESSIYGSKGYSLKFNGSGLDWMASPNELSTPEVTQKKIEDARENQKRLYENLEKNRELRLKKDSNSQPQNK